MKSDRKKPFEKIRGWIKEKAPHLLDVIGDNLPEKGAFGILKNIISKDDKLSPEQKEEFDKLAAEHELAMYGLEVDDRKDARKMYTENSELQRIFGVTFLRLYIFMTVGFLGMIYVIAYQKIQVPEWAIGSISAIWGGMSTKIGTITDFLFGSSFRHKESPQVFPSRIGK